jgi:hypothetical protein
MFEWCWMLYVHPKKINIKLRENIAYNIPFFNSSSLSLLSLQDTQSSCWTRIIFFFFGYRDLEKHFK